MCFVWKRLFYSTTILWLYNMFIFFFFFFFFFLLYNDSMLMNSSCKHWVPSATRYTFIKASTSLIHFYYIFCIFIFKHIVRWIELNWIEITTRTVIALSAGEPSPLICCGQKEQSKWRPRTPLSKLASILATNFSRSWVKIMQYFTKMDLAYISINH